MASAPEKRSPAPPRSLFDLPSDFFDSSVLLRAHPSLAPIAEEPPEPSGQPAVPSTTQQQQLSETPGFRWTCNTCATEFESLQEQREHFKSDLHRLNVKLSVAGKTVIKEEDLDKADSDSLFDDLEISSVSGSEDETENVTASDRGLSVKGKEEFRRKLYFHNHSGDTVSIWRCIVLKEQEEPFFDCKSGQMESTSCVQEDEIINRVKRLTCEPHDASHLRIILLISGGHFAGCVFDGNSIVAHKTFHRYVVRAKAGKRQSGKDATGKVAHSAGSSLRRYNEAAFKKEIHELILSWKPYFDICVCAFVSAPSKNRQMLFDGDKTQSILQASDIRPIPLTVHRPTLKEAKRIYSNLTQLSYELECSTIEEPLPNVECVTIPVQNHEKKKEVVVDTKESSSDLTVSLDSLNMNAAVSMPSSKNETTPLHEAAKSGNVQRTLELLEQGLDPCIKDSRGKTPYMMASDKDVRNTFRRFMALNLDKWDWHAADVPSPLTKEMEESQAAKQAEKDAKKKARAKELKKLKKAREKEEKEKEKTKAQALQVQKELKGTSTGQMANRTASVPGLKLQNQSPQQILMAKEEERQRKLAEEREKRAVAAERRLAALAAQSSGTSSTAATEGAVQRTAPDDSCSCCFSSLAGKIPFHRYNYKYCSTTCMHLHSEMLGPELKKKASAFVSPTPPPSSVSSLLPSIPAALDLSDASQAWFRRALGVQVSRSPTKRGDPVLPPALVLQYAEFLRMAAAISQHGLVVSSRSHHWDAKDSRFQKRMGNGRLVSTGICCSGSRKARLVCASGTPSSVMQPVQLPSDGDRGQSPKKSSESSLTLIRHGESLWNEKNLFTGCVDVPLTPKGVEEAIEAGKRICNIPIDMIYTSSLIRAQMTAMLAMMQRRRKKIPVIMHNESEQAHRWSQIYSEETLKQSIPVITAWQLNERMYGELQGLNKQETANLFGTEQVHEWRRSYDIPPPNGESLEMCAERAVAYFKEQIVPQLVAGKHVMVAAHGNSLRSIIMHLDKLTSQEVISLELSTGIPMLYIFKEGRFIRRGSPVGPSEASVYAYTKTLAKYRQKLDSMIQ